MTRKQRWLWQLLTALLLAALCVPLSGMQAKAAGLVPIQSQAGFGILDDGCDDGNGTNDDGCCEDAGPNDDGGGNGCCDDAGPNDDGGGNGCCDDAGPNDDGGSGCCEDAGPNDDGGGCQEDPCDDQTVASDGGSECCPDPSAAGGLSDCEDNHNQGEAKGLIEALPEVGLLGIWLIGGDAYLVDDKTELKDDGGDFTVGVCVQVVFAHGGPAVTTAANGTVPPPPRLAISIELKSDGCGHDEDDGGDDNVYGNHRYGVVTSKPGAGLEGEWVIGGQTYQVPADVKIGEAFGPVAVDACVKVYFDDSTTPPTAGMLKSSRMVKCTGNDDDDHGDDGNQGDDPSEGKLYGTITSFPAGLIGLWNIGGMEFMAGAGTEFKQLAGAFAEGVLVKVEFLVDANGTLIAKEIKVVAAGAGGDNDDDETGDNEGKAYGIVEGLPENLIGLWTISGFEYTANNETHFKQEHGLLRAGARVVVEYYTNTDGVHIATEIKTTLNNGGAGDEHFVYVGYVEEMPTDGFQGNYVVSNARFVTTGGTTFREANGLIVVGAYVSVEYTIEGAQRQIFRIQSEVPPGAGDENLSGTLQSVSDVGLAGVNSADANAVTAAEVWVVDGRSVVVTAASDVNENGSSLLIGSLVQINGYMDGAGQLVATQVNNVQFTESLFLPMANN